MKSKKRDLSSRSLNNYFFISSNFNKIVDISLVPIYLALSFGLLALFLIAFVEPADAEIIGIILSRTCLQMEKHNVSSNCPTYKDLLQFDNTVPAISGELTNESGVWLREHSKYKKHCNFYHPNAFPLLLVIDPDGCWFQHRGIKTITIQAITPEKMLYKLTADSGTAVELRDYQKDETAWLEDKRESEAKIDSLENSIKRKESEINRLEEDLKDSDGLKLRNINFQLKFARDSLINLNKDLKAEEARFESIKNNLADVKAKLIEIKMSKGSRFVINGTTNLGVGRYVEECKFAQVGSDMKLITDTINYLISECENTTFDSRKTGFVEQTPINIMDHKWYQYMKWQKEAIERCKVKC